MMKGKSREYMKKEVQKGTDHRDNGRTLWAPVQRHLGQAVASRTSDDRGTCLKAEDPLRRCDHFKEDQE